MRVLKKIFACVLSLALAIGATACADTRYMMTVDGQKIPAGIYLYFALNVYTDAVNTIQGSDPGFDPKDKADVQAAVFDGKTLEDYVTDESVDATLNYIASMREWERLGLSLDKETEESMEDYVDAFWAEFDTNLEKNGISKSSVAEIVKIMYYNQEIFDAYYGEGGSKNITEDDLKKFYTDNNARVKYIPFYYLSAGGDTLIGDAQKEVKDMAAEYLQEVKDGTDIDAVRSEYQSVSESQSISYSQSSVAQSEADAATATDPATGELIGTSATSSTTTATTPVETSVATTLQGETTTTLEGQTVTSTSTVAGATTTTTTTSTTTTTAKYANEIIFTRVTTATPETVDIEIQGGVTTTTTEPNYSPNKAVHDAIFAQTDYNAPFTVDASDATYLIVRYDINERMTEDDLWSETAVDDIRVNAYQQEFLDMMEDIYKTYNVQRNDSSFARYVPWKFEIDQTL
ncbi:MAG: hypothetical protein LBM93_04100 [Oscillospiraceae bacterium]|jgi:hypothetical protein|nr:hypothetical protein [Oscillospiraceae bacterium]